MTNLKHTKKALLTSVLSLFLCFTMLLGTTYAWFTDSVSSANNIITAGNLDVELKYYDNGKWADVTSTTNVFREDTLWEPGHTEVVYLQVNNAGTLALKYNLAINIVSEIAGTNKDGDPFKLSNFIEYQVVDLAPFAVFADRNAALNAVNSPAKLASAYSKSSFIKADGDAHYVAMIVYMPETVDNEANYKTGTVAPEIHLGINLFATQFMSEADSFGTDYDSNAPWAAYVDTSWYDDSAPATSYVLTSAEQLAGLATIVNSGLSNFSGVTIELDRDIDLRNLRWTPIGRSNAKFLGTFLGNGHTIKNLYVNEDTYAGLFGETYTGASIQNLTVENALIKSHHYAGVILAHGYLSRTGITGCNVKNATVICTPVANAAGVYDDGDKAGVIAGWTACASLTDNTATDCTVIAYRDLGAISGHVAYEASGTNVVVSGNKIENVTLSYYKLGATLTYAGGKSNQNNGTELGNNGIVGRTDGSAKIVIENNQGVATYHEDVVVDSVSLRGSLETAGAAGAGDSLITLPANATLDLSDTAWTPIKVDGYHGADIVTIEGNGSTLIGLNAPLFAGGFAGGSGIVIKDLTIADSNIVSTNTLGSGAFIESVDSMDTIALTNCHLLNSVVKGGSGSRTGGLIGWTAGYNNVNDGSVKTYVTIENCSVIGNTITCDGSVGGIYGHAGNNAWTYSTVKDCVVKNNKLNSTDDGGWRVGVVVGTANVGEMTISNITDEGNVLTQTGKNAYGTEGSARNLYGRFVPGSTGKLVIDGVAVELTTTVENVESSLEQDAEEITINLGKDITFDYGAREAYGSAQTQTIVIDGNGATMTLQQTDSDWSSLGSENPDATLVLKNMTIVKAPHAGNGAWNNHAINIDCNVVLENVTIYNSVAISGNATLKNVTIIEDGGYYGLWIEARGGEVNIDGLKIQATNGGRGIKIDNQYVDTADLGKVTLNIKNATFETAKKAAILVKSPAGADITVGENVDITNVAADNVNVVWNDSDAVAYYDLVKVTGATKAQEA